MSNPIITLTDVTRTYSTSRVKTQALRGLSLEVPTGVFACIVGTSGCGKSTALHLMGGLDHPTSGLVTLDGIDLSALSNSALACLRADKVGFVFQFFNLLTNLTAEENIRAATMFSANKDGAKRTRDLLEAVGLSDKANAKPSELSGGQQQRIAVARALVNDPPVLLLDEPTGNLDSESAAGVLDLIRTVQKRGKTVVLVTHDPCIAEEADVVFRMKDGQLADASDAACTVPEAALLASR